MSCWKKIFFTIIILCFFYVLKLNGFLDYSGKYGVEEIVCSESINKLFLIDGDKNTTWGINYGEHVEGENIDFRFRNSRIFSKIIIDNQTDMNDVPISIYVSEDGMNFELCSAENKNIDKRNEYIFNDAYKGKFLRIRYDAENSGAWPITEVIICE